MAKNHPLVLADPESSVMFDEFGDSSLLTSPRYFLANIDRPLAIASELRLEIIASRKSVLRSPFRRGTSTLIRPIHWE